MTAPHDDRPDPDDDDRAHLRRAVELARGGVAAGDGGPFGAVIVLDGVVIGEGWNRVLATNDPTAHAEVIALREACTSQGHFELPGATVYASGEPCPMCWAACRWARVDRILYASPRSRAASVGFDDQFLYDELARDAADHAVPCLHVAVDGSDAPYDDWAADESLARY